MQAIMETLFDILYLTTVITIGITMIFKGRKSKQYLLFGIMAVILGTGDAFHLIPRAYALSTIGLENFTAALGIPTNSPALISKEISSIALVTTPLSP